MLDDYEASPCKRGAKGCILMSPPQRKQPLQCTQKRKMALKLNCIMFWTIWTFLLLVKHGTCQTNNELKQEITVDEELPQGTILGTIGAGMSKVNPPFSVIDVPGQDSARSTDLDIDLNTGLIKVKGRIDRENRSKYQFVAFSSEGTYLQVIINLRDINDNAPEFPQPFMSDTLTESASQDVELSLGSAVDRDIGIFSVQRYEIVSGNSDNMFSAGWKEKNGQLILELKVEGMLDYELKPFYLLKIRAYDGGSPPLYGELTLNITIIDTNDNQPIFNTSRYFGAVSENATVGTSVLQVFATDTDSGQNGRINYYIDTRNDDQKHFEINPTSGILYVNKALDYEKQQAYEVIVVASDNGDAKLQTTAVVSITILNINDNKPEISITFLTQDGTGRISETAQEGDYVARISVTDADLDPQHSKVNISLQGGDGHFGLITRENIVYLTIVSRLLDRESNPSYQMTITAKDSGDPPLSDSKTILVYISDTNDNAPEFSQSIYYADIHEILPPGSSVIQISAVDRDDGNNSRITYRLKDTPDTHSDWFHVDNRTGLITTRARLDCETFSEPQLTVIAMDTGTPPLSATATIIVNIHDVNDNQPIFDQSFYNVTVSESAPVGKCILTVSATDPDCGSSSQLFYSISSGPNFQYPTEFEVRQSTGEICLIGRLDYEKRTSYDFPVVAKDQDGLETSAMVKIIIQDTNDNHPVFYPTSYNVHLVESSPSNTKVMVVRAQDLDSGIYGTVTYSIVSGNSLDIFLIDSTTGEIRLKKRLPSFPQQFTLMVRATDGGGLSSLTNANVSVSILDQSQSPPEFPSSVYRFTIAEDVLTRTLVGTVSASTNTQAEVRYSIVSGDPDGWFDIDMLSGAIRTNKDLDHDRVPYVLLNIQAKSGQPPIYGEAQVNVTITDVNDNAPIFAVSAIEIPVREDTSLTTSIYVAHAEDVDSDRNGQVQYSIQDSSNIFKIDAISGVIKLKRQLDHEAETTHTFSVTAFDLGSPRKQSTVQVKISVQDVNDNPPVFSKAEYVYEVREGMTINNKFGNVEATDLDTGNNGRVTYSLKNGPYMDTFGIFSNDGYLYNREPLDREVQESYTLFVIATDNGIPPRSSSVQVTVDILDANDNRPEFQDTLYVFYIEENQQINTNVGYVSAIDRDYSDSLTYSLSTSNSYFSVTQNSGEILTKKRLDREEIEEHTFSIMVTDSGIPPLSSTTQVKVYVLDVNDNKPVFDKAVYSGFIKENKPKGTVVTQVSAEDRDKGENHTITYSFDGGDFSNFAIHPKTGQITTTAVLDHEKKSTYVFKVKAKDMGRNPQQTVVNVEINVEDENESPPEFESAQVYFPVKENTPPGTSIGSVVAKDKDSGENGRVFYYIIRGNLFGTFGVNTTTGAIFVAKPVDFEEASSYSIQIRAMDNSALNPMSSIINVNITIQDENDNPPKFEDDPVFITLRENTQIGTHIYTFSAMDRDSGNNGRVKYTIESQHPNKDWFNIDPLSGALTVAADIDYENLKQIGLVIKATDQAANINQRLFTTVTALVLIEDMNDNSPEFHTRSRVDVMEDEPLGYPILNVIALDGDSNENGRVTFMFVKGNEMGNFHMDPSTGLITIAKSLDREVRDYYQLNITGRDHGYPQRVAFMLLEVYIVDVNDNAPMFEHSVYVANVTENQDLNTLVTTIAARDLDLGTNAELNYLIPNGIAGDNFKLEQRTGAIVTNTILDREQQSSWVLTAYVKDGAFPALYDTTTVIVNVLDENDNAPVFRDKVYILDVPENSAQAVVHTVMASDADSGAFGTVTYDIAAGNHDNKFKIDSNTGKLSCAPLDRETFPLYNLTIEASDGGSPPLSSYSTVIVRVLDDNDNDPRFDQPAYVTSISESTGVGQSILTVRATDIDAGINARITYSVNNEGQGLFKIDNVTGVISTAGEFDREKKALYNFEVYATDGGEYGPRTESVRVQVAITDINDNAPVFQRIPYEAEILATHQGLVTTVTAEDLDDGSNGHVSYELSMATPSKYFSLDPVTGEITTKQPLDPAAVVVHRLEVLAKDGGTPPKSSQGLVTIKVGNAAGMSSLRFLNHTYNVFLAENSPYGTAVVTTTATFTDGRSGSITYSFANGNEDNTFAVNPNTGRITVNNPAELDYEESKRLRLIVIASGSNAYGYTTVWVNLQDENDNPPRFSQERYTSAVWEGNDRGTYVTQIIASDIDEGDNGKVTYTIVSGNIGNAFVIDPPHTGIVKTNVILDREIQKSYKLEIEAVDLGKKVHLSSTCTLRINVIDVNDNTPQFPMYPIQKVKEGTELGTVILEVTANDIDLSPAKLKYNFASGGNPGNVFSIDTYSGKLAIAKPLDYEQTQLYILELTASDDLHETSRQIMINIEDENDNPPVFSQTSYQVALPEESPPGTTVLTVNATDRDGGENSRITYSMIAVDGFRIDSVTGTIYTNQTMKLTPSQPTIHLVVTAADHGTPALSAVAAVRVQIIDINNHAPRFSQQTYSGTVSEDEVKGHTILQVLANDQDDSPDNKKIDFTVISGNELKVFQIESGSGDLILTGSLDRETKPSYTLKIMAKDRGEPALNSTAIINIEVSDVNDNNPVFESDDYKATVSEALPIGSSVIEVHANDRDFGENGRVEYKIVSGNDDNKFEIDRDTGVVSVRTKLDHETRVIHRLIIGANDSSKVSPRQSAFTTVTINVTDVNEFDPRFPVIMYLESVLENESVGTFVFTAHANDEDGGIYGQLQYFLDKEDDLFQIDRNTGDVTTGAIFNKESRTSYNFRVTARDTGGRSATVPVSVNIEARDEYKPTFLNPEYKFRVPGNAKKGDYVGQVLASDKDGGQNGKVVYSFKESQEYFFINRTGGKIFVEKDLQSSDDNISDSDTNTEIMDTSARKRRFIARNPRSHFPIDNHESNLIRSKRALNDDLLQLVVVASSGVGSNSQRTETTIEIEIDRTCAGCAAAFQGQEPGGLTGTPLVLLIVFAVIAVILIVVIVVMYLRGRERKKRALADQTQYGSSVDTLNALNGVIPPNVRNLPPPYDEHIPRHMHNQMTTSELSDQSHSASSGRGSAEDVDEDEEIRMINATPLDTQARMPDSGIQQDDDAMSESSVQNHEQYLAKLGIDSAKIKAAHSSSTINKPGLQSSVESMHHFSDEGGGEGDGMDIHQLIVSKKLREISPTDAKTAKLKEAGNYSYAEMEPSHEGSLSSVINSEEEFGGSYNWDYLLDWGPQYQPMADVFSEIAKLKDDNIKPKKAPIKTVPQAPHPVSTMNHHKPGPPPIITDAPPRAIAVPYTASSHTSKVPPIGLPTIHKRGFNSHIMESSSSSGQLSSRTSQMTSLPSLPKSPFSYESSYTPTVMTPDFENSFSPLQQRTPSFSPIVTPKGVGSIIGSSGHTTPQGTRRKPRSNHSNGSCRGVMLASSGSEQEFRI